jgi:hypothetical protein
MRKPGRAIGSYEQVRFGPAIEADAKGILLEDPVHLLKCGQQPLVVIVIGNGPAIAAFVVNEVRRVGQDEVHAMSGKGGKRFEAIGVDDGFGGDGHMLAFPVAVKQLM